MLRCGAFASGAEQGVDGQTHHNAQEWRVHGKFFLWHHQINRGHAIIEAFQGKIRLIRVAKPTGLIFKEVRLVGWLSNCGKILEGVMLDFTTHLAQSNEQ